MRKPRQDGEPVATANLGGRERTPQYGQRVAVADSACLEVLACPECGAQVKVVAFIEPPQREVIEKILSHSGLGRSPSARPPPGDIATSGGAEDAVCDLAGGPPDLTYVDQDTFEATF